MAEKKLRVQTVEKEPIPQDGGYGWVIIIGCFMISFIIDGVMYSYGIMLPPIAETYGVPTSRASMLVSLYSGFMFLSGPLVAGLSNAFGIRTVVIGGSLVTGFSFIICAYAPSILFFYLFFGVIGGLASGCVYIGSLIIVCQYFDRLKGMATGIVMCGSGFGSFAIAPIGTLLLEKFEWKTAQMVWGGAVLLCVICGALFKAVPTRLVATDPDIVNATLPEDEKKPNGNSTLAIKEVESGRNSVKKMQSTTSISMFQSKNDLNNKPVYVSSSTIKAKPNVATFAGSMISIGNFNQTLNMKTLEEEFQEQPKCQRYYEIAIQIGKDVINIKQMFQNFELFCLVLCNFFCFIGLFVPYTYIPVYGAANNLTHSQISMVLQVIGIVNIPMRLLFGAVADRRWVSSVNLNTFAVTIALASCVMFAHLTTYWGMLISGFMFAFGTAGTNILPNSYITDTVGPVKFGNALGIVNLFRGISAFIGPPVAGVIGESLGSTFYSFYVGVLAYVIAFILSLTCGIYAKLKTCCSKEPAEATEQELDSLRAGKA